MSSSISAFCARSAVTATATDDCIARRRSEISLRRTEARWDTDVEAVFFMSVPSLTAGDLPFLSGAPRR
jgi:hypothetical protein